MSTPDTVLRRSPQQTRSVLRVEQLLDAAADVIADVGVADATTNAIAARAGASVGSLYQFFPNKDALLHRLAMRYAAQFDALKDRVMAVEAADLPLDIMMRGIVEPLAAFMDANPAYPRLFSALIERGDSDATAETRMHHAVVKRVDAMLARRFPALSMPQRHAVATLQVHTVHAILMTSLHLPVAERLALREELIRTLVAALVPFEG